MVSSSRPWARYRVCRIESRVDVFSARNIGSSAQGTPGLAQRRHFAPGRFGTRHSAVSWVTPVWYAVCTTSSINLRRRHPVRQYLRSYCFSLFTMYHRVLIAHGADGAKITEETSEGLQYHVHELSLVPVTTRLSLDS